MRSQEENTSRVSPTGPRRWLNAQSPLAFMGAAVLTFAIAISATVTAKAAQNICDEAVGYPMVCHKMKNLRSQISMLEAQRDLMIINFDYMGKISLAMADLAENLVKELPPELADHAAALSATAEEAKEVARLANEKNTFTFINANKLRQNCAACHNSSGSGAEKSWEEIFKLDWGKIVANCNQPDKHPYVCKQMHAMVTSFGYFITANRARIENYEAIQASALELARVSQVLIDQGLTHDRSALDDVHARSLEVAEFAKNKNELALPKALQITEGCMKCHSTRLYSPSFSTSFSPWRFQ